MKGNHLRPRKPSRANEVIKRWDRKHKKTRWKRGTVEEVKGNGWKIKMGSQNMGRQDMDFIQLKLGHTGHVLLLLDWFLRNAKLQPWSSYWLKD